MSIELAGVLLNLTTGVSVSIFTWKWTSWNYRMNYIWDNREGVDTTGGYVNESARGDTERGDSDLR